MIVFLKQTGKSTKQNGSGSHINYLLKNAEYDKGPIMLNNIELTKDQALRHASTLDKTIKDSSQYTNVHYLISLPKGIEMNQAKMLVCDFKEKYYKDAKMFLCVHLKEGNPHCHIVLWKDEKYRNNVYDRKTFIYEMKDKWSQHCKEQGLTFSFQKSNEILKEKGKTRAEIEMIAKGKEVWKERIRREVKQAVATAKNYDDFKRILTEKYIEIYKEHTKSLSFGIKDQERMRVRANKLFDNFKGKEDIVKMIELHKRARGVFTITPELQKEFKQVIKMSDDDFEKWKTDNKDRQNFELILRVFSKEREKFAKQQEKSKDDDSFGR